MNLTVSEPNHNLLRYTLCNTILFVTHTCICVFTPPKKQFPLYFQDSKNKKLSPSEVTYAALVSACAEAVSELPFGGVGIKGHEMVSTPISGCPRAAKQGR